MLNTPQLLKLTPTAALWEIIQSCLAAGFKREYLNIGQPTEDSGLVTRIPLSLNKSKSPIEYWGHAGEVLFSYNRLDLEAFFTGMDMEFYTKFPITVGYFVSLVADRYGIVFDSNDFGGGVITQESAKDFMLSAQPQSLRWFGQMKPIIRPLIRPISQVVLKNRLTTVEDPVSGQVDAPNLKALVVAEINAINPTVDIPLTVEECTLENPVAVSGTADGTNTRITLRIVNSKTYSGSMNIYYRRRDIIKLTGFDTVDFESATAVTTADLLKEIADSFGFYFDPTDVVPVTLPELADGDSATLVIPVKSGSMLYFGSVTVEFYRVR